MVLVFKIVEFEFISIIDTFAEILQYVEVILYLYYEIEPFSNDIKQLKK